MNRGRRRFCEALLAGAGTTICSSVVLANALGTGTGFRWTDGGGDPYKPGGGWLSQKEALKAAQTLIDEAYKQLPPELRPTEAGISNINRALQRNYNSANSNDHFVGTVADGERDLIMLGADGKVYLDVIAEPSKWKKGRSLKYWRTVLIHDDLTVEEWRIYEVCGNMTYGRWNADGSFCIPLPRKTVEVSS